jgi:hypothetical protein
LHTVNSGGVYPGGKGHLEFDDTVDMNACSPPLIKDAQDTRNSRESGGEKPAFCSILPVIKKAIGFPIAS